MKDSSTTIDDAMQLHARGETERAQAAFLEILKCEPKDHRAANMLGRSLGAQGDHDSAIRWLQQAVELAPEEVPYQFHLGQTYFASNRFEDAERTLGQALAKDPENGPLLIWLANTLMATNRTDQASELYRAGISRLPGDQRTLMHFGDALCDMGHYQQALAAYRRWEELFPDESAPLSRIAGVHFRCREWNEAEIALQEAIKLAPREAFFHAQLAELYERTGRIDAAYDSSKRAIQLDADLPLANLVLSKVERQQEEYEAPRDRLAGLIEHRQLPERLLASVWLELGQLHDALGDFDEAFRSFQEGQSIWAESAQARAFPVDTYPKLLDAYRQQITPETVRTWTVVPADERPAPVFLAGFPRSGTTLLGRILGRHSQIVTADEPPFVSTMLSAARAIAGASQAYPNVLNLLNEGQRRNLARKYWNAADQRFGADQLNGKILLDKLPLNLNHLALIRRIFPDTKVLVAIRDPRDCVLSFFFHESQPNLATVHSYQADNAAALYQKVMDLWLHNRDCLGLKWIENRYEDLVDDPEGAARRLFDFLGLAWEPAILTAPVSSAGKVVGPPSDQMVIKPVYKWSVDRWRWYEKHIADELPVLQPFVSQFGYDGRE